MSFLLYFGRLTSDPRTFVVCLCEMDDAEDQCECPGEVRFGKDPEDGGMIILHPFFIDPLTKDNWIVKLDLDTDEQSQQLRFRLSFVNQNSVVLDGVAHVEVQV